MKVLMDRNNEEYFIGVPEIGNAADNVSLLRSATDLAKDTILNKEAIQYAVDV